MKKIAFMMISAIIAVASLFAAPAANAKSTVPSKQTVMAMVPESVVVEQTATLDNGRTIKLFYQKSGDLCKVYTEDNLSGYEITDLTRLQSTSFRIVSKPQGKCVYTTTVSKAGALVKRLVNAWL